MQVAAKVALLERVMPDGIRIVAAKPVSPVVAVSAHLALARDQFNAAIVGRDSEIPLTDFEHLILFRRRNLSAAVAVGHVQPAIETPLEAICQVLLIADAEA